MPKRTVMAAWLGPNSLQDGPRSVYVCVPRDVALDDRLSAVLREILRDDDHLLFASDRRDADEDPVAAYAADHGHDAHSIRDETVTPHLIVVILDPYGDSASALRDSTLAARGPFDLVLAELPEPIS